MKEMTKVVPVDPTQEMVRAADRLRDRGVGDDWNSSEAIYAEMLAAAPSPAEPGGYDAGYCAGIEAAAKVCLEVEGYCSRRGLIERKNGAAYCTEAIRALPAAQVSAQSNGEPTDPGKIQRIYDAALLSAKGDGSELHPHLAALVHIWEAALRASAGRG